MLTTTMLKDETCCVDTKPTESSFMNRTLSSGKSLPRSLSFTTLFTEDDVLEVSYSADVSPFQAKNHSGLNSPLKSDNSVVHVYDSILSKVFKIKVPAHMTFEAMKGRIQQAQVEGGVRLLPVHMQKLTIGGIECADNGYVVDMIQEHNKYCHVTMEPRVPELISFFLSSVCDRRLHSEIVKDSPPNAEHTCIFGEMDDLDLEILPICGVSTPNSTSTALQSPCLSPSCVGSRLSPSAGSLEFGGVLAGLEIALEALSAQATPNSSGKDSSRPYIAKSFDEREALSALFDSSPPTGVCYGATSLRALLLRDVSVPEELYVSQLHLLVRNIEQARPFLQKFKWGNLAEMVLQVQSGLRHGHIPRQEQQQQQQQEQEPFTDPSHFDYGELVDHCCGGTYIMSDANGNLCAIFKPADEEPYAPKNPKGYSGSMGVESAMKPGISVGGGAARECAAYLLDHEGRAGVPCTGMVHMTHSTLLRSHKAEVQIKSGSLQRFVEHDCTAEDVGTSGFDLNQVHAIGIFDVRTFNMDRNSDNILVRRSFSLTAAASLVPIDHGYILPSFKHLEDVNCCWLFWPQAKVPYSASTLSMVAALDPLADAAMLRTTLGLSEDCLATLVIGTLLIKAAAAAGMTLYQTGMLTVRETPGRPSLLEQAVARVVGGGAGGGGDCGGGTAEITPGPYRLLEEMEPQLLMRMAAGIVGGGAEYVWMERAMGDLVERAAGAQRVGQVFHGLARNMARESMLQGRPAGSESSDSD